MTTYTINPAPTVQLRITQRGDRLWCWILNVGGVCRASSHTVVSAQVAEQQAREVIHPDLMARACVEINPWLTPDMGVLSR